MAVNADLVEIMKRTRKREKALGDQVHEDGWRSHWDELSRFLLNRRGAFLTDREYDMRRGAKMNRAINNGSPEEAVHTSAAGMMGGFTSPSIPWFVLTPTDEDLLGYKPVASWLWRQQQRMYDVFNRSNWYATLPTMYQELTVFGTGAMRIDPHPVRGIHCTQHTIGSYYLANGTDGFCDTIFCRYPRTVGQLVDKFGDRVSPRVKRLYDEDEVDKLIRIVNVVEPNKGHDRRYFDWRGMPYRTMTYEEEAESEDQPPLFIGGMEIFPTVTPRASRTEGEAYGSSRGMRALPDARQLQIQELRGSEALTKMLRPPLNVPSEKMRATVSAGQLNVYRGTKSDAVRPTFMTAFPYGENRQAVKDLELRLRDTLGASIHTMMQSLDATGNHKMTVPEIQERRAEKMTVLGPEHHSVHTEFLHPGINLTWEHMGIGGMLEDAPPELNGMELKAEFTSQLALSQRSHIVMGTMRAFENAGYLADLGFPEARDNLDADVAMEGMMSGILASPDVLRDPEKRDAMREERARANAEQARVEQMAIEAKAARDLGNAPMNGQNALEAVAQ